MRRDRQLFGLRASDRLCGAWRVNVRWLLMQVHGAILLVRRLTQAFEWKCRHERSSWSSGLTICAFDQAHQLIRINLRGRANADEGEDAGNVVVVEVGLAGGGVLPRGNERDHGCQD